MDRVIGAELQIIGTHGLQAYRVSRNVAHDRTGAPRSRAALGSVIGLDDVPDALVAMNDPVPARAGLTVVDLTAV